MEKIFIDHQRFAKVWIWLLSFVLVLHSALFVRVLSHNLVMGLIGLIIPALVLVLFIFSVLMVKIDKDTISYKYSPYHFKFYAIQWNDVLHWELRTYDALGDYGGWGFRRSRSHGKAYTIRGDWGLQLELKNGKEVLIGIGKKEELEQFLDTIKSTYL